MNQDMIKYNIFFDESEVKSLRVKMNISLMGCLRMPESLYKTPAIQSLTDQLRERSIKLHFTDYHKRQFAMYSKVLKEFFGKNGENIKYLKFNLIAYSKDEYINGHTAFDKSSMKDMEYAKIPERVIYGSIRNISKYKPTEARLFIENSTEYTRIGLNNMLKKQLNVQSLYRNDNFIIKTSLLYPKGKEIGIEITDMILGIISIVIRNGFAVDSTGNVTSKTLFSKKDFIYKHRLLIEPVLENVYYFEMNGLDRLTRRDLIPFWHEFIIRFEEELVFKRKTRR